MSIGDLRRWDYKSSGGVDVPFLLVSIEEMDVTVMDEGETYSLSKIVVEEFSEPVEEPNDQD